jgi:hypothetical protein
MSGEMIVALQPPAPIGTPAQAAQIEATTRALHPGPNAFQHLRRRWMNHPPGTVGPASGAIKEEKKEP